MDATNRDAAGGDSGASGREQGAGQTTTGRLIRLVACGLQEGEAETLRKSLPADSELLIEIYTRDEADTNMLSEPGVPVILVGGHDQQDLLMASAERPLTQIILLTEGRFGLSATTLPTLTLVRRPMDADHVAQVLQDCLTRLFSESLDQLNKDIPPLISPVGADGVVVIDRYNHILFMDHNARRLTVPRLLHIIESVSAEDYPLAGACHGMLPLPGDSGRGLQLDARSVDYDDKNITVIRLLPNEAPDDPFADLLVDTEDSTGLLSRDSLTQLLNGVISQPEHSRNALVLLDLDRMKVLTEGAGHHASDHAISVVGARLHALRRTDDYLARIGNDEFALLVRGAPADQDLDKLCEKWLRQISEPINVDGRLLHLTASIGSVRLDQADGDVSRLFRQADVALAYARKAGGNRHHKYSVGMSDDLRRRWDMESKLREALAREQFHLEFQPLYQSGSSAIVAAETLLRWDDPSHGRIYPDQFIPLLEETRLIVPVGEWILQEACKQAVIWQKEALAEFRVSVNLSPVQVEEPGLQEAVMRALNESGLKPEYLVLEITEQVLLEHTERAHEVLTAIADTGVKLFLDDFGTGYSSLSYLKRFPVCGVKIDRSFIDSLPDGEDDRAITLTILDLCRHLDLWGIPEGIENAAQASFLTEHGATLQQGFFYSKPIPAKDLTELLTAPRH